MRTSFALRYPFLLATDLEYYSWTPSMAAFYTCSPSSSCSRPHPSGSSVIPSSRSHSDRQYQEALEILRIMDPSYLSPQQPQVNGQSAKRRNSRDYYYVDELRHLHDIDYRPFPLVYPQTSLESKREEEDVSLRPSPRRFHTSPNPRPRSPQVPYWETFAFPQYNEPEEVDPFATLGRSYIPTYSSRGIERQEYNISYTDRTTSYPINSHATISRVQVDERTGKRVLTKPRNRKASVVERTGIEGGTDIQDEEDEDKGVPSVATVQANGTLGTLSLSPKQKLKRTWVTTRFSVRLKVIRTQRWLKERVQG